MTEWIALSRTNHAEHTYAPREGYGHASGQVIAPVMLAELPKLLPHYVVGFLAGDDGLLPVAVLGVEKDQNLYLHPDGRWLAKYVPATLRGYPFVLANNGKGKGDKTLSIAADHLLEHGGKPLFDNGEPAKPVADTLAFLTQCEGNRQATLNACQMLEKAGVLSPWTLTVPIGEGHKQVNGLYRVDEQTLNALDAETYATLQGAPMQLAYGQLYSMAQVDQLTQRHALQEKLTHTQAPENLDAMFGEGDDELEFDFDS
ncbi:SapC family protein [Halomonas llamarensis]|uniref:SapC family protein n=1 Tax=Halomonas llamarensis TaxID=2945104 RepID=A0ABT0SP87_9GAMM|nr:SapC family protein [Halomonas llamarensis]MCL7929597.1 SapC family protein [Halomonas llamarensis]